MRSKGFTLFELLVVLILISIMSAVVMPRFNGSEGKLALRTAAKNVSSILRNARNDSILSGENVAVKYSQAGHRVIAMAEQTSALADPRWVRVKEKTYELPDDVRLDLESAPSPAVSEDLQPLATFFPIGNATGNHLVMTDPRGRRIFITIEAVTGIVSLKP